MQTSTDRASERVIGDVGAGERDPLFIVMAGIHGNEASGIHASRRIFERIARESIPVRGRLVAIAGNLVALERGVRFVDADLNRLWTPGRVDRLLSRDPDGDAIEESEQRAVIACISRLTADHQGSVVFLDLHSTSGNAPPFCIISDTLQNRQIAFALHVPVILGLEETISGTIQEFWGERGYVTAAVEGGQHDDPSTTDLLESALWIAVVTAGIIDRGRLVDLAVHRRRLADAGRGLPDVVEVIYRHERNDEDGFAMKDGYESFDAVRNGEVIAEDAGGEIRAEADGLLLMPSYQPIGDDGYFIGRRVKRRWLRLSTVARRLRLDRGVHWLPGVSRCSADGRAVRVDPAIARWWTPKVFHLLGFRKHNAGDGRLFYKRRPEGPRF